MNKSKIIVSSLLLISLLYAGGKNENEPQSDTIKVVEERPLFSYTSLKVGTLGLGVDFAMPINQYFYARININGGILSIDTSRESVNYNNDLELLTAGALLDYYPSKEHSFRISAGAYYYANKVKSIGRPNLGNYDIGGTVYSSAELGSLDINLDFPKFAPYIGLGYGGKELHKGWNFSMDIGLMYHGKSDLSMNVNRSSIITNARYTTIVTDAEKERQDMEDELNNFPFYPVLMLGMNYNF